MIRARTDDQVLTSAAQMDAALSAGMTREQLGALSGARTWWHQTGQVPTDVPGLPAALAHPGAPLWDAVFVAAARKLSDPAPSVHP